MNDDDDVDEADEEANEMRLEVDPTNGGVAINLDFDFDFDFDYDITQNIDTLNLKQTEIQSD